ncbi:MAG: sensor histidine kinase [Paracoccaceae bacterium]
MVDQANAEPGQAGSDIVLGDDWVRPQSSVDTEVRIDRARRGFLSIFHSPLARKIIMFNMLALVMLVAGMLSTNPFRDSLTAQQELALVRQAEAIADLVGGLSMLDAADSDYNDPDEVARRRTFIESLSLDPLTEVLLANADGTVEVVQRGTSVLREQSPLSTTASNPPHTIISDILDAIWLTIASYISDDRSPQPNVVALLTELNAESMQGQSTSRVLRLETGFRMLSAAPVLRDGQPVGTVIIQQFPDQIEATLRAEREQVLQMFVIALIVSVGLSLVLASTIANPLADLATAAELGRDKNARRMSPGRVRIPDLTGRPDEIGRLSQAMRGMVSALYDRIDANEQFAADVAHEIKNPLASLRSAVGTLRVAKREDQVTRLLDVIEHDVRRLDRLISDTSNASRLDSELVKEEEETFNLLKTLDNLCQHLAQEAQAKGVEFITELPRDAILIQGLEARLAQVFVNLITNAISFCGEGDAVRIWARKRENRVLIVVEDTGPGIPESALGKVFKRFYSERPQEQFGNHSGLGLAISKQIVEAHGGVIWAENIRPTNADRNSPPLGARFVVGLPV